jgi:hypothetical protein
MDDDEQTRLAALDATRASKKADRAAASKARKQAARDFARDLAAAAAAPLPPAAPNVKGAGVGAGAAAAADGRHLALVFDADPGAAGADAARKAFDAEQRLLRSDGGAGARAGSAGARSAGGGAGAGKRPSGVFSADSTHSSSMASPPKAPRVPAPAVGAPADPPPPLLVPAGRRASSRLAGVATARDAGFAPDGIRAARLENHDGTFSDEVRFALVNPRHARDVSR